MSIKPPESEIPVPTSSRAVVVSCKVPNGLFLDVVNKSIQQRVAVRGSNHADAVGGFGITENVDADHWEQWLAENKQTDVVKNGFIFASGKVNSARDEATDKAELTNDLEPLNQDKPVPGIEKAKLEAE